MALLRAGGVGGDSTVCLGGSHPPAASVQTHAVSSVQAVQRDLSECRFPPVLCLGALCFGPVSWWLNTFMQLPFVWCSNLRNYETPDANALSGLAASPLCPASKLLSEALTQSVRREKSCRDGPPCAPRHRKSALQRCAVPRASLLARFAMPLPRVRELAPNLAQAPPGLLLRRAQVRRGATGRSRTSRTRSRASAAACPTPRFASTMSVQSARPWTCTRSACTWPGAAPHSFKP